MVEHGNVGNQDIVSGAELQLDTGEREVSRVLLQQHDKRLVGIHDGCEWRD